MADLVQVDSLDGGAFWRVAFGAAKGNILDRATMRALAAVFREARTARTLKAVCLEGAGSDFSYGASVQEHLPNQVPARCYAWTAGRPSVEAPRGGPMDFDVAPRDQLRTNLLGLGIPTLETEVQWSSPDLVTFFQHEGFTIAPRLCLDMDLARTRI